VVVIHLDDFVKKLLHATVAAFYQSAQAAVTNVFVGAAQIFEHWLDSVFADFGERHGGAFAYCPVRIGQ
jgi:hypothetical protein